MDHYQGTYIIACSGGPDSMALFEMARRRGLDLICAHVNYHKRDSALRDEKIVEDYCQRYGIPFEKTDGDPDISEGNFQDYARKLRYRFFAELCEKYSAKGVLVAHHLDDLLETYSLQKEHGGSFDYLGLKRRNRISGVTIIRPLLRYTKEELLSYCVENDIPYGIDESNQSDHYRRNLIRHSQIEKMTKKGKLLLKKQIDEENRREAEKRKEVKDFLKGRKTIPVKDFLAYPYKEEILRHWLYKDLSARHIEELIRQIEEKKDLCIEIRDKILSRDYGMISAFEKPESFSYTFEKIAYGFYPPVRLKKSGKTVEGVTVTEEDFPVTLRNAVEGDEIAMRFGNKKVNRFFIDRKIPKEERMRWPVLENREGVIIYVYGLGCDKDHHSIKDNWFMLKY